MKNTDLTPDKRLFHYLIKPLLILFILVITFNASQSDAAGNISVSLSQKTYVYSGKAIKPKVIVKYNGKKLASKSYTIQYGAGRTKVGKYSVNVKLRGKYKGTKTVYFKINPQKPVITSLSSDKSSITVNWEPIAKEVTGYQISYDQTKSFASAKTVLIKGKSATVNGLNGSSTYFVRIRSYKTIKGIKYYSSWSAIKKITTITNTNTSNETPKKSYHFRNEYLLNQHFEKHGREMGFNTAQEYEAAASDVVNNPKSLHKTEKEDGDDCYYLEETNDFVIVSTDGYIRTYFRPDKGKEYFDKQ